MRSTFRLTAVALTALALAPASLHAQRIRGNVGPTRLGVFGGPAISTMSGVDVLPQGSHNGFQGGLNLILPFTENFSLRTGMAYVQKGVNDSLPLATGVFDVGYLEFPFMLRMIALPGETVNLHALAGYVIGFKASCKFRVDSIGVGTVYDGACGKSQRKFTFDIRPTDNSAVFGLDLTLMPQAQISYEIVGTWELALNSADPAVQPLDAKNRVMGVTAGIIYNFR